jgi:hypothetical protein
MQVVARHELLSHRTDASEPTLLLEGSWPAKPSPAQSWSLDEAIDARHGWIDRAAAEYAEAIGRSSATGRDEANIAYLNALALRYYLVKLLRVVAFFDQIHRPPPGTTIELHLQLSRDAVYVELLKEVAHKHFLQLRTEWHAGGREPSPSRARGLSWRRWAAHAGRSALCTPARNGSPRQRVVLCGNPHLLDGVCKEFLERGCRVWWLHEQFAVHNWRRWRRHGVGQLTCEDGDVRSRHFTDGAIATDLVCRGVDLAPAVDRWLARMSADLGGRQLSTVQRVDGHFRAIRPTHLVLDEDATPLKRAVVMIARHWGTRSTVVQHGAPCGPFGFAPLTADEICVWGETTRRALVDWGVPRRHIRVTGWPDVERRWPRWARQAKRGRTRKTPTILLLATVPPRDSRPDTVEFHLTRETHEALLDMACAAVAKIAGARIIVKLHPRTRDARALVEVLNKHLNLRHRLVRSTDLDSIIARCDCVLSCASTAGIEAALAGAPVVQLLPGGSGDVLPAEHWGLVGSARDARQLDLLLAAALALGWSAAPRWDPDVLGDGRQPAVAQIADAVLGPSHFLGSSGEEGECRPDAGMQRRGDTLTR